MTAKECFDLINQWKAKSFLSRCELMYDSAIYGKTVDIFWLDYIRWYPNDTEIDLNNLILTPQLHAILTYRIARLFFLGKEAGRTNLGQKDILSNIGRMNSLSELYYSADIGYGLKLNHGISTVVGARCKIGNNCLLHQHVTLGDKGGGRPVLGNNCVVYAGASILGDIHIGNNAVIGANAIVLHSFPNNAVLVGVPDKNIKE